MRTGRPGCFHSFIFKLGKQCFVNGSNALFVRVFLDKVLWLPLFLLSEAIWTDLYSCLSSGCWFNYAWPSVILRGREQFCEAKCNSSLPGAILSCQVQFCAAKCNSSLFCAAKSNYARPRAILRGQEQFSATKWNFSQPSVILRGQLKFYAVKSNSKRRPFFKEIMLVMLLLYIHPNKKLQ